MSRVQCPLCESQDCNSVAPYRGHSALFQERSLLLCSACSLVFTDPMPTENELLEYNRAYFSNAHDGLPANAEAHAFFAGIARLRLCHIRNFLSTRGIVATSVLEIGPGLGYLCAHYRSHFPEVDYAVVETDRSCHARLAGVGARVFERLGQLDAAKEHFELLVLSHALEHMANPMAFMQSALLLLKVGGVLFIEVPCRDYEFKPEMEPHLLFFDKLSMRQLLTRLDLIDLQLTYHGKEIERLKAEAGFWAKVLRRGRRVLNRLQPASRSVVSIEGIDNPAESAAVASYEAHLIKERPSWWLRALARKQLS